jgi:hypothetical protein
VLGARGSLNGPTTSFFFIFTLRFHPPSGVQRDAPTLPKVPTTQKKIYWKSGQVHPFCLHFSMKINENPNDNIKSTRLRTPHGALSAPSLCAGASAAEPEVCPARRTPHALSAVQRRSTKKAPTARARRPGSRAENERRKKTGLQAAFRPVCRKARYRRAVRSHAGRTERCTDAEPAELRPLGVAGVRKESGAMYGKATKAHTLYGKAQTLYVKVQTLYGKAHKLCTARHTNFVRRAAQLL